ncbi:MAG TPA: carboxymuconolactone decarboxylase family protein [Amycolatopsis sp.]|nr:carboxymuconolactone decarboxylase family protein [Amycolatopsis sp.]
MTVSLQSLRAEALGMLESAPEGPGLDAHTAALVDLGVRAAVTALDVDGIDAATRRALDAGATAEQVHDAVVLVSGLGVHSLMEGSRQVAAVLAERGHPAPAVDRRRAELRERCQGGDRYWDRMEREVPGFLDALLRLSPEAYEAFFSYCAVPWQSKTLSACCMELISMATDATPTHRYLPGMRLHLANALRLGAGRAAILGALDIAAVAPAHPGVPAAGRAS